MTDTYWQGRCPICKMALHSHTLGVTLVTLKTARGKLRRELWCTRHRDRIFPSESSLFSAAAFGGPSCRKTALRKLDQRSAEIWQRYRPQAARRTKREAVVQ